MNQIAFEQAMRIAFGHHQAGRLAEAEGIYRQVLARYPEHADALHLLGVLACHTGHHGEAIDLIGRAIAVNPNVAEFHHNLGEALRRSERPSCAIVRFRRAIELKPDLATAHANLGHCLKVEGHRDDAIASYRRAILLDPENAETYLSLGLAVHEAERPAEAIAAYRRAIELRPDRAETHTNLGIALNEIGQSEEALSACSRAIMIDPDSAWAHFTRGNILWQVGRLDDAVADLSRAIELKPDFAEAHNNLANAFKDQGRVDEALAALERAMAVKPDFAWAASHRLYLLHYNPDYDATAILEEHRRWARRFAEPLAPQIQPHGNDRSLDRRLRVGFLSTSFHDSAQGQLIQPLFFHHDRGQYEFVCYSDTRKPDAVTAKLKAMVDEWHDTSALSDPQAADLIRAHRIDILVDLTLHTANSRLLVFARKPAPIQVTALEMITTTGLATMDYRLTDCHLDPPGETDSDYTEQSLRLPHCLWCYWPPEGAPPVGHLPAMRHGAITFGCLNYFVKISRPTQALWARVLQAVPSARIIIHAPSDSQRGQMRRVFEGAGIARSRIEFVSTSSRLKYLQRHADFDMCLDTQPYAGGTTTMDALWMGVPVVTLASRTAVGRGGASILSNVGFPELIAATPERYVALAVEWARDLQRLAEVRAGLRERMQASPLMDGKRYAADVEEAFRGVWKAWCVS